MPYPASLIAYAFVKKGIEESKPVTQMKLQKLVYFAHGYHLAIHNEPLIIEKFQAWKYGPVVPEIYSAYKLYGSDDIDNTDMILLNNPNESDLDLIGIESKSILDITWNTLKKVDALRLSAWTHNDEDSPWRKYYQSGVYGTEIPDDEIKNYFRSKFIKK